MNNSNIPSQNKDLTETVTVDKTRRLDLCICCEICSVVCPADAIHMEYQKGLFLPRINHTQCTKCGLCLKSCPGIDVDPYHLRKQPHTNNMFDGPALDSFVAYSHDHRILRNSTSGGLITHLIVELIKNKEFDCAFVLDFDKFDGTAARLKGTGNIHEILKAAKSKYVPVSLCNVIKTIVNNNGKYIIVGTACQFQGIKKTLQDNGISEEKLLFLGLFCDGTLNYNFIHFFENIYKKKTEELIKFDFRNKEKRGWPGDVKLSFSSGREIILNRKKRVRLKSFFRLNRCLFCLDKLNTLADIAVGDCYIKDKTNVDGRSNIIIRTNKGQAVFERYRRIFSLERTNVGEVRDSQGMAKKKANLENVRILVKENDVYENTDLSYDVDKWAVRKLLVSQRFIKWGQNNKTTSIKITLLAIKLVSIFNRVNREFKRFIRGVSP
jgi:coenzyme F420 hydrogenase subunit beta